MPHSLIRVDLRRLILWMCLFFVFLALVNSLHAAYKVQHGLLLQHSVDTNRAYAEKLAQAADSFLKSAALALETAALDVTESRLDPVETQKELNQLAGATDSFNAIIAVDLSGKIFAATPNDAFVPDATLETPQARQLLNAGGETAISGAFQGPAGRWLSVVARPIFAPDGSYAGFVGGTLHLRGASALQNALNKLRYQNGAYFYIVDAAETIVYHPERSFIGSTLGDKQPLPARFRNETDTRHASDTETDKQLISYAPIPFANWVIVAQWPTEVALSNIDELFLRTFYYSLPVFIISLLAIWWLARLIARPLHELAEVAANLDNHASFSRIRFIKGWYVEAALIRKGLMQSFSAVGNRIRTLHREGSTDPLTGLVNRRGLDSAIERLTKKSRSVAVVMIDIDHFKAVNDNYGHAAGDEVLKGITNLIMAEARKKDVVARMGGEEFVILLPETNLDEAKRFAERLRATIEQNHFVNVGQVTISLGIAGYPEHGANVDEALTSADAALYRAKAAGRNLVRGA